MQTISLEAAEGSNRNISAFKRAIFSYFQPVVLALMVGFWLFAPDKWASAEFAVAAGVALRACCLWLERVNERYASWRLTWKELVTDLFYVALVQNAWIIFFPLKIVLSKFGFISLKASLHQGAGGHLVGSGGSDHSFFYYSFLFLQICATVFLMDLGQYALHRWMHNWYPLWLIHAPHHFVTQLNTLKEATGNIIPVYMTVVINIFVGLLLSKILHFPPRVGLAAGAISTAINVYSHANVRFYSPRWWMFLFNTIEHHSLHHSQDYESTRCNYATTLIVIDRIFGTFVAAEAERVGQEGGRHMSIREQMLYPVLQWVERRRRAQGDNRATLA